MLKVDISEIEGISVFQGKSSNDSRGSFVKFSQENVLSEKLTYVAVSKNPKVGTIRGLHFQVEPYAEEKIVSCIQGSTFEVIVDIRPNSRSYGRLATFELSQENGKQVYLPKGIAHGFQTLLPETIVHYCLTSEYSMESAYTIHPLGDLNIAWPVKEMLLSKKDLNGTSFENAVKEYARSLRV